MMSTSVGCKEREREREERERERWLRREGERAPRSDLDEVSLDRLRPLDRVRPV